MKMKSVFPRLRRFAVPIAAGAVILGGVGASAQAGTSGRQAFGDEGSVYHFHVNDAVEADYRKVHPNTVWTESLNKWSVTEEKLHPAVQSKLKLGEGFPFQVSAKPIEKIGGSYTTNATTLGQVTIPEAGLWRVDFTGVVDRVNADADGYLVPNTDTMPQITARVPLENGSEANGGTAMGSPVSRNGFTELTLASAGLTIRTTGEAPMYLRAFGYNENRSSFGSDPDGEGPLTGQFTAAVHGTITRIG